MNPVLVLPQEQNLDLMLNRVLAILEEQDKYALPGYMNRRCFHQEEEDEDDSSLPSRCKGAGDICSFNINQHQHHVIEREISDNLDGIGNIELPIIVIRPVARRPRRQPRRRYEVGVQRSRKVICDGGGGGNERMCKGVELEDDLKRIGGYRNLTQCSSQNETRASRSRSRSPIHRPYSNDNSSGVGPTSAFTETN